jgi:hypothetical protein
MRVGICLSGVPRWLYRTDFINKIATKYDTYLFLFHWKSNQYENLKTHSFISRPADPDFNPEIYKLPALKHFESSSLVFEDIVPELQSQYDRCPKEKQGVKNLAPYSMCYAIKEANKLREQYEINNNFKFDLVMKCRFETYFFKESGINSDFDFSKYDLNYLWKPMMWCDRKYDMNDCFAFSNSENMSHYSRIYDNLYELSLIEHMHPETVFYHHNKHLTIRSTGLVGGCGVEGHGWHAFDESKIII